MLSEDRSEKGCSIATTTLVEATWRRVFSGGYRVLAWHDRAAHRYVVVAPQAPPVRGSLSTRQRRILAMRARGTALKVIAFETGLSVGTVSRDLSLAMDVLGLGSLSDLAAVLGHALERPSAGEPPCPEGLAIAPHETEPEALVLSFPLTAPGGRLAAHLTPAERAVVDGILAGLPNREIAEQRGVSPRTIANQISSIFAKLHVGSRLTLALTVHGPKLCVHGGAGA
jgi:DNA-binding NarL/FixJ family response regulator